MTMVKSNEKFPLLHLHLILNKNLFDFDEHMSPQTSYNFL